MTEGLQEVLGPASLISVGLLLAEWERCEDSGGADVR